MRLPSILALTWLLLVSLVLTDVMPTDGIYADSKHWHAGKLNCCIKSYNSTCVGRICLNQLLMRYLTFASTSVAAPVSITTQENQHYRHDTPMLGEDVQCAASACLTSPLMCALTHSANYNLLTSGRLSCLDLQLTAVKASLQLLPV